MSCPAGQIAPLAGRWKVAFLWPSPKSRCIAA